MPKASKYPRLQVCVRRGKAGQVWVYHYYDRRAEGLPDIALGTDREAALRQWEELHNGVPRRRGTLEEAFERWEREELPGYSNRRTRAGYEQHLAKIRPVFGPATWDTITLPTLVDYLRRRSGKVQANREISLLSLIWGKARMWGMTAMPFPAADLKGWKNREQPRRTQVTDELFTAVYAQADQTLRDCMDLATATGMRLTDCRTIQLPPGDVLRLEASKTGKRADFDVRLSDVLPELLARRRAMRVPHLMLLTTERGKILTDAMLRHRWDTARHQAAKLAREQAVSASGAERIRLLQLAEQIEALYLRDMRKRAADLAGDIEGAARLLQHSSQALTQRHYRTAAEQIKPVR